MSSVPDEIFVLQAKICSCGTSLASPAQRLAERRRVFELREPRLQVKEYQRYECDCPFCGKSNTVPFPGHVKAPAQYGSGVKAIVVLLSISYKLPFLKISRLFADIYGYAINESTIVSSSKDCYEKLAVSEGVIKESLKQGQVIHFDETGIRVAGKLHWLHTKIFYQLLYTAHSYHFAKSLFTIIFRSLKLMLCTYSFPVAIISLLIFSLNTFSNLSMPG